MSDPAVSAAKESADTTTAATALSVGEKASWPVRLGRGFVTLLCGLWNCFWRGYAPTFGRFVGNTLAVAGVGLTILAVWKYWPGNAPSTPKPSLIKSLFVGEETTSRFKDKAEIFWLLAAWAIVPPLWFLAELAWSSPYSEDIPAGITARQLQVRMQKIEEFKYMQSLSRAIWVAVLAVLAVLFGVSISGSGAA